MKVNPMQEYTAVPADAKLPTKYGDFRIRSYIDPRDGAEHAACHHHDFLDAGIFVTQLSCEPETTHSLLDRIVEIYQGAEDDLSTNEVDQARNKLLSRVVLAGERPRQRLFSLGLEWAHLSRYRSVSDDLATLDTISREDLHRILAEWHLPASSSTVLAGPLSNKVSST